MGFVAGGRLAAAVSAAGALGLIGGGYGEEAWLREQLEIALPERVGCGFITFALAKQPHLLDLALSGAPAAMFLSFADPEPFAAKVRSAGVPLFCQVQTMRDATHAIDIGADVLVAQGTEAGGHGERRGTVTLVPEVADLIAARSTHTLLCAAGGIADGRGLAAALALGADGAVLGTRLWATQEALVHPNQHRAVVAASGDETIRSTVIDIAKGYDIWPSRYTLHTLRSRTTDRWHGHESEMRSLAEAERAYFAAAVERGDVDVIGATVGEAIGIIRDVPAARDVIRRVSAEAEAILDRCWSSP